MPEAAFPVSRRPQGSSPAFPSRDTSLELLRSAAAVKNCFSQIELLADKLPGFAAVKESGLHVDRSVSEFLKNVQRVENGHAFEIDPGVSHARKLAKGLAINSSLAILGDTSLFEEKVAKLLENELKILRAQAEDAPAVKQSKEKLGSAIKVFLDSPEAAQLIDLCNAHREAYREFATVANLVQQIRIPRSPAEKTEIDKEYAAQILTVVARGKSDPFSTNYGEHLA